MNQFHLIVLVDCLPGYYGLNCRESCRYPNYGVKCQEGCNCSKIACNHIIGCLDNALDGKMRERKRERERCVVKCICILYTKSKGLRAP